MKLGTAVLAGALAAVLSSPAAWGRAIDELKEIAESAAPGTVPVVIHRPPAAPVPDQAEQAGEAEEEVPDLPVRELELCEAGGWKVTRLYATRLFFEQYDALDIQAGLLEMTPGQRRVLEAYAASSAAGSRSGRGLEAAYAGLSQSQRKTFDAVIRALENTRFKAAGGEETDVLDLVEGVIEIHGSDGTGQGRTQFRLIVSLRPGAIDAIRRSGHFDRGGTGHVYYRGRLYKGLPDFRSKGRVPRLQISYWRDGSIADVDIDYRGLWEGHLDPYNSDVMARGPQKDRQSRPISNLERYERRWPRLPAGWSFINTACLRKRR